LDVTVIADAAFDPPRQEKVRRMLQRRIGRGVAVRLILVDQIEPDPSGKHRYVVSQAD
jgi:phenylacetate-CoA ligase